MATLFISDLHLEDARPKTTELLLRFLDGPAREAETLFILGDLFEYWIGDDALSDTARTVGTALRALNDSGVSCHFMHGNRDFLLGPDYARLAGMTLLPESLVLDLHGRPTLLLHGDTLCTDDADYQAFRVQVRDPAWQARFLAMPVDERLRMARQARDASRRHTRASAMEIMDVNEHAVLAAFEAHGVRHMIHGHTHRPAFHSHELNDGSSARRIVLADWHDEGSALRVTAEGAVAETVRP